MQTDVPSYFTRWVSIKVGMDESNCTVEEEQLAYSSTSSSSSSGSSGGGSATSSNSRSSGGRGGGSFHMSCKYRAFFVVSCTSTERMETYCTRIASFLDSMMGAIFGVAFGGALAGKKRCEEDDDMDYEDYNEEEEEPSIFVEMQRVVCGPMMV